METEIKLLFKDSQTLLGITGADWFSDYCLDTSPKKAIELKNTYYDTPDKKLVKRGAMVRVRHYDIDEDECYEHTVKFGGGVSQGLHQRYEWNVMTDKKYFKIADFKSNTENSDDPDELLDEALEGISDDELEPICSTEFERTIYTFGYGDSIMEACFDVGMIRSGDKAEEICELELELTSGDVVDLKDMGDFIIEQTGCKPGSDSKFSRALRLAESGDN